MTSTPNVTLNNGVEIPQFGLGTWQIDPAETRERVLEALELGYRHIDTAQMYRNEQGVGDGLADSGLGSDEVFITTKLHNVSHDPEVALKSLDESLEKLRRDSVDLFLIHWPLPMASIDFVDTWHALEEAYRAGKARAIGVSNFQANHLRRLVDGSDIVPAVNQIEVHPYFVQDELRAVNAELGILTEAWSPLAQGQVFDDAAVSALATEVGKSEAQVVLRWHIQRGDVIFPKASSKDRLAQNLDIFDFELSEADLGTLTALDRNHRIGPDPDSFDYGA